MPDNVACVKICFGALNELQVIINTKLEGRMQEVNDAVLHINYPTRSLQLERWNRPCREMEQTVPRDGTDRAARWNRPCREMEQTVPRNQLHKQSNYDLSTKDIFSHFVAYLVQVGKSQYLTFPGILCGYCSHFDLTTRPLSFVLRLH
jgi:hypothetical protein